MWEILTNIFLGLNLIAAPIKAWPFINLVANDKAVIETISFNEDVKVPQKKDLYNWGVKLSAQSAAVLDLASDSVLWQKNADEQRSIASITKLMTMLVFLEHNKNWDHEITMEASDEVYGDAPNILRGETVNVRDVFFTALMDSDNNAVNALVRSTGIEKKDFVDLMNKKAAYLGLSKTHFIDVTGLSDDNVSTAKEVLQFAKIALAQPDIVLATENKVYNFVDTNNKNHKVISTNRLLDSYLNVLAGKTGFINAAGYCLVAEIEGEQGQKLIGVVLGSATHDDRFADLKILLGWTLENFSWF